jgi:hypothetical protein
LRTECGAWGRNPHVFSGDTMSVTITDEQYQEITRYLAVLLNGDGFEIMNKQPLHSKLAQFMATLPMQTLPEPESIENVIRNQLSAWSPPSCP